MKKSLGRILSTILDQHNKEYQEGLRQTKLFFIKNTHIAVKDSNSKKK